ncbi:muscarinic acetylcholine receptor M2-like [Diadema setosum]|uniref:muscarinic acetylcholine receptor M2-like n=1 Tax=Diadema setosum TaxID=31175 RepID=UPI003B3ABE32
MTSNWDYNTTFYYVEEMFLSTEVNKEREIVDGEVRRRVSPLNIVLGAAMTLLTVPTVMANSLILIAFLKSRHLRTYFNFFVCSMACADLVVGCVTMPIYSIEFFSGGWPFGPEACLAFSIIDHVFVHISVLSVLVIAIDRYRSLSNPLAHLRKKTLARAVTMLIPTYVAPIPLWSWFVLYRKHGRNVHCYTGKRREFPYNVVTPFLLYIIPLIILISFCIRIYNIIRKRGNDLQSIQDSTFRRHDDPYHTEADISAALHNNKTLLFDVTNPTFISSDTDDMQRNRLGAERNSQQSPSGENATEGDIEDKTYNRNIKESFDSEFNADQHHPAAASAEISITAVANGPDYVTQAKYDRGVQASERHCVSGKNTDGLPEEATTKNDAVSTSTPGAKRNEENSKAFRTLTFVVMALVFSWSPWAVLVFVVNICGQNCSLESAYSVSFFWVYINSLLNPLCYAAANRTFRRVIVGFFRG